MRFSIRDLRLQHLNQSGNFKSGNPRFYYRPKGQKGVAMPDLPIDHPGWLAAYAAAAGVKPRAPVLTGSIAQAAELYKASTDFKLYSSGTRAVRASRLEGVVEKYGHAKVRDLKAEHIEKDLSRFQGHSRNNHLKMWRAFGKWLKAEGLISEDPTKALAKVKTARTDGHEPWTDEEIAKFRDYWASDTKERLAFELIYWTGARVSDAIRMGEQNIDKDGWLVFKQQKTGGEVAIPFRRELPSFAKGMIVDLVNLHYAIEARKERHLTFIVTEAGSARSSKAVSQWFAAKARDAGLVNRTAHGLRKSRAMALAAANAGSPAIGAWTGHVSLSEIERYIRKYDKRRVLSETKNERKVPTFPNEFQKPEKKVIKSNGER